jgi:hypothetical protein
MNVSRLVSILARIMSTRQALMDVSAMPGLCPPTIPEEPVAPPLSTIGKAVEVPDGNYGDSKTAVIKLIGKKASMSILVSQTWSQRCALKQTDCFR